MTGVAKYQQAARRRLHFRDGGPDSVQREHKGSPKGYQIRRTQITTELSRLIDAVRRPLIACF